MYRRRQVQRVVSTVSDVGRSLFKLGGAVAWVVATSVLVVVIPLGIELEYDQQAAAWEAEALAQQQQAKQVGGGALRRPATGAGRAAAHHGDGGQRLLCVNAPQLLDAPAA